MTFIALSAFFPEPNPDNSLQYQKEIPPDLEMAVLNVLGWKSLKDVPMGEHELTANQAKEVMSLVGTPFNEELMYCLGLCRKN